MSALSSGLLGFFGGALGGAEEYIQEEREFNRKMSLEEFAHQKQQERMRLAKELDAEFGAADAKYQKIQDQRKFTQEAKEARISAEQAAEGLGYEARRTASDELRAAKEVSESNLPTVTESEKTDYFTSIVPDLDSFFPKLAEIDTKAVALGEDSSSEDKQMLAQDYIKALRKNKTTKSGTAIFYLQQYLDGSPTWDHTQFNAWRQAFRTSLEEEEATPEPDLVAPAPPGRKTQADLRSQYFTED